MKGERQQGQSLGIVIIGGVVMPFPGLFPEGLVTFCGGGKDFGHLFCKVGKRGLAHIGLSRGLGPNRCQQCSK